MIAAATGCQKPWRKALINMPQYLFFFCPPACSSFCADALADLGQPTCPTKGEKSISTLGTITTATFLLGVGGGGPRGWGLENMFIFPDAKEVPNENV